MRSASFIARPLTVQVLTGIVLVLFCVTFLRFISLTFADEAPHRVNVPEAAELPGIDHAILTVEHELKLRAMQNPEGDERLRTRLGLDETPIPIMH